MAMGDGAIGIKRNFREDSAGLTLAANQTCRFIEEVGDGSEICGSFGAIRSSECGVNADDDLETNGDRLWRRGRNNWSLFDGRRRELTTSSSDEIEATDLTEVHSRRRDRRTAIWTDFAAGGFVVGHRGRAWRRALNFSSAFGAKIVVG